jgi:hypothetical protein
MKNDNASERAVALVHEAVDVLLRAEHAPDSPVNAFVPAKRRRELRRAAVRLRQQKAQPRYRNLHTSEQLADIYERTVQRDEILERGGEQFRRITRDLGRLIEENGREVENAVEAFVVEAQRSAEEHGPGSEAARRYRQLQLLAWFGQQSHVHHRRQRALPRWRFPLAEDPSIEARNQMTATEVLDALPAGEAVIDIPPDGSCSGRPRVYLRIGLGEASWVGTFETGYANVTTVSLMPDDKHLFISAEGAGYIIDLESRTLVETIGTEVAGVMLDYPRTVFIVDHGGLSLEAFGRSGRLWKTDAIGSGGFRNTAMTDSSFIGEARTRSRWAPFSVDLASGDVSFANAGVAPKSVE